MDRDRIVEIIKKVLVDNITNSCDSCMFKGKCSLVVCNYFPSNEEIEYLSKEVYKELEKILDI